MNVFRIGSKVWYPFGPNTGSNPKYLVVGSSKEPYIDRKGKAIHVPDGYDYLILPERGAESLEPTPVKAHHLLRVPD